MKSIFYETDEYFGAKAVGISVIYKAYSKVTSREDREFSLRFNLPLTEGLKKYLSSVIEGEEIK